MTDSFPDFFKRLMTAAILTEYSGSSLHTPALPVKTITPPTRRMGFHGERQINIARPFYGFKLFQRFVGYNFFYLTVMLNMLEINVILESISLNLPLIMNNLRRQFLKCRSIMHIIQVINENRNRLT